MSTCNVCHQDKSCFDLEFDPEDTDAGEKYALKVCGTCWEIIAKIANLALDQRLRKIEEKLSHVTLFGYI